MRLLSGSGGGAVAAGTAHIMTVRVRVVMMTVATAIMITTMAIVAICVIMIVLVAVLMIVCLLRTRMLLPGPPRAAARAATSGRRRSKHTVAVTVAHRPKSVPSVAQACRLRTSSGCSGNCRPGED